MTVATSDFEESSVSSAAQTAELLGYAAALVIWAVVQTKSLDLEDDARVSWKTVD